MSDKLYNILNKTINKLNQNSTAINNVMELKDNLYSNIYGIHIKSNKSSITLSIKCVDEVRCLTAYDYVTVPASENTQAVTIDNPTGDIFIENTHNILDLDVNGQQITSLQIFEAHNLSKLIVFDNDLHTLDLSNCPKLQILHMHNNPICDDYTYKDDLYNCMNSLTNRLMSSTGSITLYPWYGLEVLICKNDAGQYIKYPLGYSSLAFEEGQLYGLVENNKITYYKYVNNELVEQLKMNRHHSLRKELEDNICLSKNWVFGSAIMYTDDWEYCTWDFRKNNIADMWETAEKGFGLTWGCIDAFTNTLPGFENLNIKDIRRYGASDYTVEQLPKALDYTSESDWKQYLSNPSNPYTQYKNGNRLHGDAILSLVFGTQWSKEPLNRRFGYIPNACALLHDGMTLSGSSLVQLDAFDTSMKYLANGSDTLSFSFGLRGKHDRVDKAKTVLGKFGENNVLMVSAGNNGDGLQYTSEPSVDTIYYGSYTNYAGDYSDVDEEGNNIIKPTSTIYIGSCGPLLDVSPFSNSSVDVDLQYSDRNTYLTAFGDQLFVWNNYLKTLKCGAGTSYAAPICSSILLLLRNIYSKMFANETCFGKCSNFMSHVRNRWCIHNDSNMDFAEGYGVPNVLAEPYAPKLISNSNNKWEPVVNYYNGIDLGNSINIEYTLNNSRNKRTYTVEPKLSYIAIDSENKVYPLIPKTNTSLKLFSNSSLEFPTNPRENYHTYDMVINSFENKVEHIYGNLPLQESNLLTNSCKEDVIEIADCDKECQEFTIQFALDFTDKLYPIDAGQYNTSRDLFYFYNGDELGRFYINNIKYNSGDSFITLTENTMLYHRYFSDVTSRNRNLIETQSVGFGINNKLDFEVSHYAIISVTFSKDWITYYLNGTYIGRIIKIPGDIIKLCNVYINKQSLCHDGINCVRAYDRVLSDKEIIQNTIYMLNKHFDEETK